MELYDSVQRLERKVTRIQTLQFVLLAIIVLLLAVILVQVPSFGSTLSSLAENAGEALNGNTLPAKEI